MDKKYICYCGLYCENCAVKAKIEPAAVVLLNEMQKAGFEETINYIPNGEGFWSFLKQMASFGLCISCKEGGGDPRCPIRICARDKGLDMCALCSSYPCNLFSAFLERNSTLEHDNMLLRDKGFDEWAELQDKRKLNEYTLQDDHKK